MSLSTGGSLAFCCRLRKKGLYVSWREDALTQEPQERKRDVMGGNDGDGDGDGDGEVDRDVRKRW